MDTNNRANVPQPRASRWSPWHVWVVGVVFFLFYLIGIYDYFMMLGHNEDYYASMGFDATVHAYFTDYPWPFLILWTVNVFSGPVAAVLLLARRRTAEPVALVCALSVVMLAILTFALRDRWNVLGPQIALFDIFIVGGGTIGFYLYSRMVRKRGVLR